MLKILLPSRKRQPLPSTGVRVEDSDRRRQQGRVVKYDDRGFGFIGRDNDKSGKDVFFSRRSLTTRGQLPKIGDRVEFSVTKDVKGRREAVDILVQVNHPAHFISSLQDKKMALTVNFNTNSNYQC